MKMSLQQRVGYGGSLPALSPHLVIFSYFAKVVISPGVKSEEKCMSKQQILITVSRKTSSY
jgi:hypothetical protein